MLSSKAKAAIAFLPFGYQFATRIGALRDLVYLVVSGWIPALWIAQRTGQQPAVETAIGFVLGFLAFISLYELGYLVNDAWDAKRHRDSRHRLPFEPTAQTIVPFCAIRVATWLAIAVATGWIGDRLWLAGHAALVAAMLIHNLLASPSLRLASFAQMASLRFLMPVVAILTPKGWLAAILTAILLYVPLRYLAYADSKGLAALPDRKGSGFAASYIAIGLPLLALLALAFDLDVLIEISLFLAVAHWLWPRLAGQVNGAKR